MKIIYFCAAVVFMATVVYAQQEPREIKRSIFFDSSLDEYTEFQWDDSYSLMNLETRFSASGAKIESIEIQYNASAVPTTKITRDVENRLKNRVVYQYNPQGHLWRESLVDNRGRVVSTYEYAYNGSGNLTSRVIMNRSGDKLAETTYAYDDRERLISSQTRDFSENAVSSTQFEYNAQGNLIRQTVLDATGTPTSIMNITWSSGNEVASETRSPEGTVRVRVTNAYGTWGELVERIIENIQNNSRQTIKHEYVFRPRQQG